MDLSSKTTVSELLQQYPFLLEYLVTLSPRFSLLKNPIARSTVANVATLAQAASIGKLSVDDFIAKIAERIKQETGIAPRLVQDTPHDAAPISDPAAKHEMLKAIIRGLHDTGDIEEAKRQFAQVVRDVDASQIAAMEQRLIAEGMPQEEIKRLCDVHVKVFKESIEIRDAPNMPAGHPVATFMAENRHLENLVARLEKHLDELDKPLSAAPYEELAGPIGEILHDIAAVNVHYLRKENQLFPVLERHGVTGPTQVMWSLDDDIRAMIKKCAVLHAALDGRAFRAQARDMLQALRDMIYKEERILFPMSLETLGAEEWDEIRAGEREIGYAWITPPDQDTPPTAAAAPEGHRGVWTMDTGALSLEQINLMLTTLPFDISFVDENDEVRYYSASRKRLFPRSPAVIGRKVQNCHPPKSISRVQEILDAFRRGTRSEAEFWIQLHGKFVHIRYFAMRDAKGAYRGCLEVTQDITAIRSLEGERRLLQ